jgi:hypothetical protein
MKVLVSCDQVFDVLTRGPFSAATREGQAVQRHLEVCHECRQLAEALRPAVELLHEALPAEELSALPAYGAGEEEDAVCRRADGALAARIRQMLDRQEVQPRRANLEPWVQGVKFMAACVLVVALGTLVVGLFAQLGTSPPPRHLLVRGGAELGAGHQPSAAGVLRLTALDLPTQCFTATPAAASSAETPQAAAVVAWGHACCTRCHAAGKSTASLTPRTFAVLAQSCSACHES